MDHDRLISIWRETLVKTASSVRRDDPAGIWGKTAWIWLAEGPRESVLAHFRKSFQREDVGPGAVLRISAETNYQVWLNGRLVGRGQFSDFPRAKTYQTYEVDEFLRPGENVLGIEVYHRGVTSLDYQAADPGVMAVLRGETGVVGTDGSWRGRWAPEFSQGHPIHVTPQMGLVMQYDLRQSDGWMNSDYQDAEWSSVVADTTRAVPVARPLALLEEAEPVRSRVVSWSAGQAGVERSGSTVAGEMQADILTAGPGGEFPQDFASGPFSLPPLPDSVDSWHVLVDLEAEEVGFLTFDVEAPAGTILDVAHGEHSDGRRVAAEIGGRNFADRFVLKEGRQTFTMGHRRIGARFLQFKFHGQRGPVRIFYAGLIPVYYPVESRGAFACGEAGHEEARAMALRTMRLCMHEHYEDCPWREQSLYAGDSMLQAMFGYYAFGEPWFPEVSLTLLGGSVREDGYLELTSPGKWPLTIPSFSMMWIQGLRDFQLYTGRGGIMDAFAACVESMVERWLSTRGADGLMPHPPGAEYWRFYDWVPYLYGENLQELGAVSQTDALLNLHLLMALQAMADLAHMAGQSARSAEWKVRVGELKDAIRNKFWNPNLRQFSVYEAEGEGRHSCPLGDGLAVLAGLFDAPTAAEILARYGDVATLRDCTALTRWVLLNAQMAADPHRYGPVWAELLTSEAAQMRKQGSTTLWETPKGAEDFEGAGSLCHAWSSLIIYLQGAYILGVRPLSSGFREVQIAPVCCGLQNAEGTVPVPNGEVRVAWKTEKDGFTLKAEGPPDLVVRWNLPPGFASYRVTWNGGEVDVAGLK